MDNIGGAEMVTLELARQLGADIYTTNIEPSMIDKMGYADVLPRIHSIGRVPLDAPWRHQAAFWRFGRLRVRGYDRHIVSGDWAISASRNHHPIVYYSHSPPRELWDLRESILAGLRSPFARTAFRTWSHINRRLNRVAIGRCDAIACNSRTTQARLKHYLGVDAKVIYPPVDTRSFSPGASNGFWLSVNRLTPHKRIEMQLDAFRRLPDQKLVIVGSYEKRARQFESYRKKLESLRPANVEIRHWVDSAELKGLYAGCVGFIATAKGEDFGMAPVEAMAAGKPVIAAREGGYTETVVDGITGALISDIDADRLASAIRGLDRQLKKDSAFKAACARSCAQRAKTFATGRFVAGMRNLLAKEARTAGR